MILKRIFFYLGPGALSFFWTVAGHSAPAVGSCAGVHTPPERKITLNLGGEGEIPGVWNINLETKARSGRPIPDLVIADMRSLPVKDSSVDQILCNRCPSQGNFRFEVAQEAYRALKAGGSFSVFSMTGGGQLWVEPLTAAGFQNVRLTGGKAIGEK